MTPSRSTVDAAAPLHERLLPCPFCGGEAEMDTQRSYRALSDGALGSGVAIYCTKCGADMMHCYEDHRGTNREDLSADLSKAWNRRAAPLRSPEGEVAQVIAWLQHEYDECMEEGLLEEEPDEIRAYVENVRAALAQLRRLGQVEAERDRALAALEVRTWTEEERDGMAAAFALNQGKHGHFETLFAVGAWLLRHRRAALAPAPAAEGE